MASENQNPNLYMYIYIYILTKCPVFSCIPLQFLPLMPTIPAGIPEMYPQLSPWCRSPLSPFNSLSKTSKYRTTKTPLVPLWAHASGSEEAFWNWDRGKKEKLPPGSTDNTLCWYTEVLVSKPDCAARPSQEWFHARFIAIISYVQITLFVQRPCSTGRRF